MTEQMRAFDSYRSASTTNIDLMANHQRILYAIATCCRLSKFYETFSVEHSFGSPSILYEVRKISLETTSSVAIGLDKISRLRKEIESHIPDSNNFENCSNAMDASLAHLYLLEYLIHGDIVNIVYIAELVYDLIDRSAQDSLESIGVKHATEEQIETHDIIVLNVENEQRLQSASLSLANSEEDKKTFLEHWRMSYIQVG